MKKIYALLFAFVMVGCQSPNSAENHVVSPKDSQTTSLSKSELVLRHHVKNDNILVSALPVNLGDLRFFEVSLIGVRAEPTAYALRPDLTVVSEKEALSELKKICIQAKSSKPLAVELATISRMLVQPTNGGLLTKSRLKNLRRRIRDERLTLPTLEITDTELSLSFWVVPTGKRATYKHFRVNLDAENNLHVKHEKAEFKSKIYE